MSCLCALGRYATNENDAIFKVQCALKLADERRPLTNSIWKLVHWTRDLLVEAVKYEFSESELESIPYDFVENDMSPLWWQDQTEQNERGARWWWRLRAPRTTSRRRTRSSSRTLSNDMNVRSTAINTKGYELLLTLVKKTVHHDSFGSACSPLCWLERIRMDLPTIPCESSLVPQSRGLTRKDRFLLSLSCKMSA